MELEVKNGIAKVDRDDYPLIEEYKWRINNGYVLATVPDENGKYNNKIYLHHLVFGNPPKGSVVHFKNLDRSDCRKENLEFKPISEFGAANQQRQVELDRVPPINKQTGKFIGNRPERSAIKQPKDEYTGRFTNLGAV
jgi:hypothetical protein